MSALVAHSSQRSNADCEAFRLVAPPTRWLSGTQPRLSLSATTPRRMPAERHKCLATADSHRPSPNCTSQALLLAHRNATRLARRCIWPSTTSPGDIQHRGRGWAVRTWPARRLWLSCASRGPMPSLHAHLECWASPSNYQRCSTTSSFRSATTRKPGPSSSGPWHPLVLRLSQKVRLAWKCPARTIHRLCAFAASRRSQLISTLPSRPSPDKRSKTSTAPRLRPGARTTVPGTASAVQRDLLRSVRHRPRRTQHRGRFP